MNANANDTTNDTPRPSPNPFVVPGSARAEPKSTIDTHQAGPVPSTTESRRQGSRNPFVWVVPNKPTSTGQEGNLDNESNPMRLDSEPDSQSHDHGDPPTLVIPQRTNNDARTRTGQPRRTIPEQSHPNPKTKTEGPSIPRRTIPTGVDYSGLLDDHDDDDRTSVNGHSEEWQPIEDGTPWPGGTGDDDDHVTGDDETPFVLNGVLRVDETGGRDDAQLGDPLSRVSTRPHGGDGDQPMTTNPRRSNVTVSDSVSYAMDSSRLREGVQIGTVKRELLDYNPKAPKARRTHKKQPRLPFSPQIPKILDFLSRWRIGTTVQLARVAGWRDSNEGRLVKKLRAYDEVGFIRETDLYAGPKIWTATEHGAELGSHPWLGGVKRVSEINPMSQSHSFGLSSIASWLLCPGDDTPNILGLDPDEWTQVRGEIKAGTAYVLSEKEYRSAYASIRTLGRGLIPAEYRHGFIGYGGHENPITGAWREWARSYKNGASTLADSPELLACDPEFMGANMWMWIIWGNSVWNPKVLETRAGQEVDLDDLSWAGRDGESRLLAGYRHLGYVPIEERVDYASNKPVLNKALGDRFALWDHLPDLIIARRRTDDGYADPQSIAIELELSAKTPEAYARTMAAYGSQLGQTLYRKVIWLVPSKTIAVQIRAGASQVGMILGEDYEIVPFVTSNEASVIKRSFYSGADILPGRWTKRGTIEPTMDGRSIPLA